MLIVSVIGWRVDGFLGALVATVAICAPSSVLTFAVAHVWNRFRDAPLRVAIQYGLAPVTVGLVLSSGYILARAADKVVGRARDHHRHRRRHAQHAHSPVVAARRGRGARCPASDLNREAPIVPELPDVTVYVESLAQRIVGHRLDGVRLPSPFVLRTAMPPIGDVVGKRVLAVSRIGKRIVIALEDSLFLVLHLMIAGRLRWLEPGKKPPPITLALFEFDIGTVAFTEAGTRKRASLHVVRGDADLAAFDMGGLEVMNIDLGAFSSRLTLENHTVKRALTDPHLFSGIGNAYSDEILHRARLSPIALTQKLSPEQIGNLYSATRAVLAEWTQRLRLDAATKFPEKVTAFRPEMAVHGRFGKPCPDCGAPVQRIVYAENETNYCAACQTGGTILADRALSRLLKASWPRSIDELG